MKEEKIKRGRFSVRKFENISKVTVLFTSVAGPELPRVRRLRNVLSSGSSDESLAKGYVLIFYLRRSWYHLNPKSGDSPSKP
jgi:hypothetical protein